MLGKWLLSYVLVLAVFLQSTLSVALGQSNIASTGNLDVAPVLPFSGPTESEFKAAFSDRSARLGISAVKVDPILFQQYVALHAGQGRLLTGPELAMAVANANNSAGSAKDSVNSFPLNSFPPKTTHPYVNCDALPFKDRKRCRDSTTVQLERADSLATGSHEDINEVNDNLKAAENNRLILNLGAAVSDADGYGDGVSDGLDGDEWAAIIYVVVGVVVVGAFILYGVQTIYNLIVNKESYPLFLEAGTRFSYSGKAIRDPEGKADLYRDVYFAGLRFAIGFDRPGMGMGVTVEGGYIDVGLHLGSGDQETFDIKGGYLVAGPMLRFGKNEPYSFSLEFLNGSSNHRSIGLISKSRMTLEGKVTNHILVGGHLGAVFYDLEFLDGLGWRGGSINQELSFLFGLDIGWEF